MSTFGGLLDELPGISIDNFEGPNLDSRAFFLSHCHSDHMKGLFSPQFVNVLMQPEVYLYVSAISAKILEQMHPSISSKLKPLNMYHSELVKVPNTEQYIEVSLISAGHCPGSVMFLFETDKTVLYTGDFRIDASDLDKIKHFRSASGELKRIHHIYLDTTFLNEDYKSFPRRDTVVEELLKQIREWTEVDENKHVALRLSAKYAYEFLFIQIWKHLKMKVHVSKEAYDLYKCIPDMDGAITIQYGVAQIHASCAGYRSVCGGCTQYKEITLSAMYWRNETLEQQQDENGYDESRLCYATHSSYEEIKAFLLYLKPAMITPCVVRDNPEKLLKLIEDIEKEYSASCEEADDESENFEKQLVVKSREETRPSGEYKNDLLDSPPRSFKRQRF